MQKRIRRLHRTLAVQSGTWRAHRPVSRQRIAAIRTKRRKSDARNPQLAAAPRAWLAIAALTAFSFAANSTAATGWQSIEDIKAAALNHIASNAGGRNARFKTGYLDPRLKLSKCSERLETSQRNAGALTSRAIVGVACPGPKPWKIFVPIEVTVTDTVLVAKRNFPRDAVLTADDVILAERDVSKLKRGYLTDVSQLQQLKVKRSIVAGEPISPAALTATELVRRGQSVILQVESDSLGIRMNGEAMTSGARGQRIRVRNSSSGRIVEGVVRSREVVEILVN